MDDVARSIVARLCDAPDDEQLLGVLADHLLARGDPRAQVIALELAGQYEEARRLVDAHLASSLPAQLLSSYAEIRWHRGFLYTLNLSDSRLPPNADERDLPSALRATLAHPSAALLRELIVSSTPRMRFNEVVAALADEGAPCLRQLEIGSARGRYRMVSSYAELGDLSGMWRAVPRLEQLCLTGVMGSVQQRETTFGDVRLPRLRRLRLHSCGLGAENAAALARARWDELEHLELALGATADGFGASADVLEPLLRAERLPRLRSLGLMSAEQAVTLCELVAQSDLLPQLERLSFAAGTLAGEGARQLLRDARAFAHLRLLDLELNYLDDEQVEALRGLCAHVRLGKQRQVDPRYVEVYPETQGRSPCPPLRQWHFLEQSY